VHPQVSVITGISLDHQSYLGNTLTKIAGEKAGIIKEGVPAISGCSDPAPRRVIRNQARRMKAPLLESFESSTLTNKQNRRGRFAFDLCTPRREYKNLRLSLAGEHQTRNAVLAVMAIESLKSLSVKKSDIRYGLANTRWAGRLDEYSSRRRTLLDGAHNPEGAKLLRDFLLKRKEKELHFVFGAVRDKDIRHMTEALFPLATSIHLTPLVNTRTANPADIALMHKNLFSRMLIHSNMQDALDSAWSMCAPSGLVVITGSLYLVGELLPAVQAACKKRL
jgi:dihydrofolate synthase / folylpolyglutamate synthase